MKATAIVGGVTITIVILAASIVFSVAGLVFTLRYLLPLALAIALICLIVELVKKAIA